MSMGTSIRDKLHTIKVEDVTQAQINSASGPVFLSDRMNLNQARDIASYAHSTRSFGAWPDPGGGQISTADGTSHSVTPSDGNEFSVYAVSVANAAGGTQTVQVQLYDGSNDVVIAQQDCPNGAHTPISFQYPIIITPSLYLRVVNATGGTVTISAAYHNVVRGS